MALPLTTDQPDRSVAPAGRTLARNFFVARLGSLLAFAPLGVWTVVHLWHQLAAYESPQAWEIAVTGHVNVATTVLVFVLVLGPLLFLVMLVPFTINGLAVREAFFVSFLGQLGVDKSLAFDTGFLFFLVTIALSLPGVAILGWEGLRRAR